MTRQKMHRLATEPATLRRALAVGAAMGLTTLAGCAAGSSPVSGAGAMSASAEARSQGKYEQAVSYAEQAVLVAPRDPRARAELGSSYLAAGRFDAASQAFDDALELGDVSPRTALGFALSSIALGDSQAATDVLDEWRDAMAPADLGLAYALAGNPEMGVQILTNALRAGQNTPVMRQNLAYAYALGGEWAATRIIAAEDVAPGELDQRITTWVGTSRPEDYTARVADLLGVEPQADPGMPARLALGTSTTDALIAEAAAAASDRTGRMAANTDAGARADMRVGELPPSDRLAASTVSRQLPPLDNRADTRAPRGPVPADDVRSGFGESASAAVPDLQPDPQPVTAAGAPDARFVSSPVVQRTPARPTATATPTRVAERPTPAPAPAPVPAPAPAARSASAELASGSHLVQLGSYGSEVDAKRGWTVLTKRYPQLKDREQVITRARVRGRIYYRLSAGDLAAASARSLCATVKADGNGCIAWEASRPLPGSLDRGSRVASR